MNRYKKFFYNSESFFLLRTTGWLVGFTVAVITTFLWTPLIAPFVFVTTSIITDLYLFRFRGLKESSYKKLEALKNTYNIEPEQYDKYAYSITKAKPAVLLLMTVFFVLPVLDEITLQVFYSSLSAAAIFYLFIMNLLIAGKIGAKYGLVAPHDPNRKSIIPWYHGIPGYNRQGTCTGSDSAIGGISH